MVFGPEYGLDVETAKKLGRPLGSGMGGKGLVCGSVSGAVLILGLAQPEMAESTAKKRLYRTVRELMDRFTDRYDSVLCRSLLDADLNTRLGRAKVRLQGVSKKNCPGYVNAVAEILERLRAPDSTR